jgi:hypothetical protein
MGRFRRVAILLWLIAIAAPLSARGTVIYTYDFPGTPGSGLASDQSSTAPAYTTFGDWNRVNLTAGGATNVFESTFWNTTAIFDATQYESFTITADAGWHLNLQLLTFDEMRTAGGPTKGRIQMFINGSAVPYDIFNYNPSASFQNQTFNFTPTTDADNVTTVEFRFYGWNGGTPEASLILDNVAITLDVVPEPNCGAMSALFAAVVIVHSLIWKRRKTVRGI